MREDEMRLGKNQRERLAALGCPGTAQVVACKVTRSLERLGLLRTYKGGFACITPAGLRVLADELESGRVESAIEWAEREWDKNRVRKAAGKFDVTRPHQEPNQ